jgi:hypothetical protein
VAAVDPEKQDAIVPEDGFPGGVHFADRPTAASLVFIACSTCRGAISLADAVKDVVGNPVCWDCGGLSLVD